MAILHQRRDPLLNSWFALAQIRAFTGITYMEADSDSKVYKVCSARGDFELISTVPSSICCDIWKQ
jgi:hypothetical protein